MAQFTNTMKLKTRKVLNCPVFRSSSQLSSSILPMYADIMKFYLFVKNSFKISGKELTVKDISEIVAISKVYQEFEQFCNEC